MAKGKDSVQALVVAVDNLLAVIQNLFATNTSDKAEIAALKAGAQADLEAITQLTSDDTDISVITDGLKSKIEAVLEQAAQAPSPTEPTPPVEPTPIELP